ncbi:response regulator transcription factor [Thetidibacter halocola]|uniref:Response regulator transcription factor n=1 Tax=Thetidibacter halocola TaxID=2827239 RepID=A0A8J7WBZ7_9RHOB|nr:response regulator transcription factor [Thetidibacter halocola]MBS0124717.1 response regulator transcription factor [Thetidibacter halocola]
MRYLIAETSWTMMNIARRLVEDGSLLTRTDRPEDIAHYLRLGEIDAVVLEGGATVSNGLSLAALRAICGSVPVVLIADRAQRSQIAEWLAAGADTVISASTDPTEISARILAVARRAHGCSSPTLTFGPLHLDLARRRAQLDGAWLHLTPKVYEILEFMALRAGTLVTRDALLSHVYGLEGEPDARVFDVYMCTLRGHLKAAGEAVQIQTMRGEGFRFVAEGGAAEAA